MALILGTSQLYRSKQNDKASINIWVDSFYSQEKRKSYTHIETELTPSADFIELLWKS